MTFKDKLLLTLLGVFTLGIYPIIVFTKKPKTVQKQLTVDKPITSATKLISLLGGKDNIASAEYTHTKIKVFISDKKKVDAEGIKNLKGVSGIVMSSKYATIIVGKQAAELSKLIIK